MKVKNKKFSTIWIENREVKIIDQTKLPFKFKVEKLKSLNDFCKAIKDMKVRGAPLIGVTAAFGFAKSIEQNSSTINIKKCYDKLLKTRPTAINLKWALDTIKEKLLKTTPNKTRFLVVGFSRSEQLVLVMQFAGALLLLGAVVLAAAWYLLRTPVEAKVPEEGAAAVDVPGGPRLPP